MADEAIEKTFTQIVDEISDEELTSLAGAIKQRYGIDFTNYEKKSLKRGFARLVSKNNFKSILELWGKIIGNRDFFLASIDDLLVNLTEMFRNPEIWIKLKGDVLPKLALKQNIVIWHAGCSTGEEIYTMAIVLREANLLYKAKITATDLSTQALEQAKLARYQKLLWKKYMASYLKYFKSESGHLENYFEITDQEIIIKDDIKKNITYLKHNLVTDPAISKCNIIFCRNVMIYFDDALKMRLLKKFHDALEDDGYFIIGFYDMLPNEYKDLYVLYDAETRIYKKNLKK